MRPWKIATAGAVVLAMGLVGVGAYPRIKESLASSRCRDAADCGACCAAEGCSFSEEGSDPATGLPMRGTCACGLTASDSVLAAPVVSSVPQPVGSASANDEGLGRRCEVPADCAPGQGCMRFDDRGQLLLRQSTEGALRCTRECGSGCPAGFYCSSVAVPVTGGRPVMLSACGRAVAP